MVPHMTMFTWRTSLRAIDLRLDSVERVMQINNKWQLLILQHSCIRPTNCWAANTCWTLCTLKTSTFWTRLFLFAKPQSINHPSSRQTSRLLCIITNTSCHIEGVYQIYNDNVNWAVWRHEGCLRGTIKVTWQKDRLNGVYTSTFLWPTKPSSPSLTTKKKKKERFIIHIWMHTTNTIYIEVA